MNTNLTYNEWIAHILNQLAVEKKKEIEKAKVALKEYR
jgi:hypothetical protein